MRKNKMMRAASALLVAVLLTTSVISGTFAKYVTTADASDTARVAMFGVTVTASGSLFDTTYKTTLNVPGAGADDTGGTVLSVTSSNSDKLVAPGTKNDDGLTFTVAGTPEVDVKLDVVVKNANGSKNTVEEVFLKEKTGLPDMTTGLATDTFNNDDDYYPVKFTLTRSYVEAGTPKIDTLVDGKTLAEVETALEALSTTFNSVNANTDLAEKIGTLKLTWAWDFDGAGAGTYDKQDTLLGDLAAGTTLTPTTTLNNDIDYDLDMGIKIDITVTQID